jgi:hypothetical protein
MWTRGSRPGRGEIDEAALTLVTRHGGQIMATARRYAATPEDAEDAYQRGLEILLTKAPTAREDELIPWLKTVVTRTFDPPAPASHGKGQWPTASMSKWRAGGFRPQP